MLILQRRAGESILIGSDIEITVIAVDCNRARIAISAPQEIPILRSELIKAQDANKESAQEQSAPDEFLHMLEALLPEETAITPAAHPLGRTDLHTAQEHERSMKGE